MIGSELAARAPKDGYTLLVNGANFVTTPSLYRKVTYDPVRDFEPISVMFMPAIAAVAHVKSGRLRALAVTSRERLPALKELPTVAESGLSGYQSSQWYGMLAPAGTSLDVVRILNSHVARIMHTAEMRQRMTDNGSLAVGSTREEFAAHIKEEFSKWAGIIKRSGARVD